MATKQEISKFIDKMIPLTQYAYKKIGKIHPSVAIAMACVESAYGTKTIMAIHHAYFGQKVGTGRTATENWSGKAFSTSTKEEYQLGVHTNIVASFRAYDTDQEGVLNFYELLNSSLYKKVERAGSPEQQMKQIKECGYMTSSTEVDTVLKIISKYNLKTFDFIPTCKKGDRGYYVMLIQKALSDRGYIVDNTGYFGDITEQQVIAFQGMKGLTKDGIVGVFTWSHLIDEV